MSKHLFISGPTMVDDSIRDALLQDDISHRDITFENLFRDTQNQLYQMVNADKSDYVALLTTGSGSSSTEAMISSFLPNSNTLIISNGEFGNRLIEQAKIFNVKSTIVKSEIGTEFDLDSIEQVLYLNKKIENILISWVETSTGILNPIEEVYNLSVKYNKNLYIDSVSAIGCENIDLSELKLTCIVGHSGKAIGSFPGIGIIICKRDLFKKNNHNKTYYLNLFKYFKYAEEYSQTPHTPAVQLIYALNEALKSFNNHKSDTLNRFQITYDYLSFKLNEIGIKLYLANNVKKCCSVIAAYIPDNISFETLKNELSKKGFIIYGGRGYLQDKNLFLVSNMSKRIDKKLIDEFINAFDEIIRK